MSGLPQVSFRVPDSLRRQSSVRVEDVGFRPSIVENWRSLCGRRYAAFTARVSSFAKVEVGSTLVTTSP